MGQGLGVVVGGGGHVGQGGFVDSYLVFFFV